MELYFNSETKEYVFFEKGKGLVVSEKEFKDIMKFGMSGIILKLQKDQAKARGSSQ